MKRISDYKLLLLFYLGFTLVLAFLPLTWTCILSPGGCIDLKPIINVGDLWIVLFPFSLLAFAWSIPGIIILYVFC